MQHPREPAKEPTRDPGPVSRRQREIASLIRQSGRVAVDELAARFGVTAQTIRRDLTELSEARIITRTHGGAVVASGVENLAYDARKLVAHGAKARIGEAAARLIPDHASLFINLGTTTEEVAQSIAGHDGLLVVTNNINVANALYRNGSINVIIAGGTIRASDGGIVGQMAADVIRQFKVDIAVIGTSAIDEDGTLLDYDIREVQVSRAIIENAHRVVLVTDSSKFSRTAPVRIGRLDEIDVLVTDRLPSPEIAGLCRRLKIEVIETGDPDEGLKESEELALD